MFFSIYKSCFAASFHIYIVRPLSTDLPTYLLAYLRAYVLPLLPPRLPEILHRRRDGTGRGLVQPVARQRVVCLAPRHRNHEHLRTGTVICCYCVTAAAIPILAFYFSCVYARLY
jgi:hypothetical protein